MSKLKVLAIATSLTCTLVAELGASVGHTQAYTSQGIIGGWGVLFCDSVLASLLVKVSITTTPHAQYSLCSMMTQYSLFQVVESVKSESGKSVWRFFGLPVLYRYHLDNASWLVDL